MAEEQVEPITEIKTGDGVQYLFEAQIFPTRDDAEEARANRIGAIARRFYAELPQALAGRETREPLSARERAPALANDGWHRLPPRERGGDMRLGRFALHQRGSLPISPPAWRMKKRRAGPMASTMPSPRSRKCRSGAMSLENSRFSASVEAARVKESNRRQRS